MSPEFLDLQEVLEIHRDQIERYGGSPEIRDLALLRSAIAMPQAGIAGTYLHGDYFEMAAAYLFHIIQNHPFVDGNKRTGVVAALVFLDMNDIQIQVDEKLLEKMVWSVAKGEIGKESIAKFFRGHVQKRIH